jgi:membrane associated rhomboid family serine protease
MQRTHGETAAKMASILNQSPKKEQLPWVTYALLLICALSMLHSKTLESSARPATETAIAEAAKYWKERPYLEAPSTLISELGQAQIDDRRTQFQQELEQRSAPDIPRVVQRHSQEHLDDLIEVALKPMANLPRYRIGLSASDTDPSTYLTYFLVHSGWLHLFGTGILLLILGHYLERRWGPALFGLVTLASALAAAILFAKGNPDLSTPLIGTSGIAAGLLAAFMIRFAPIWKDLAYPFVLLIGTCWLLLPVELGWQFSLAESLKHDADVAAITSASYWAIGGGFGCGLLASALIMLTGLETRMHLASLSSSQSGIVHPGLERAYRAQAAGRIDEAYEILEELLEDDSDHVGVLLAMWQVAREINRPIDASRAMLRAIREEVRCGALTALDHWRELTDAGMQGDADPVLLIRIAMLLREANQSDAARATLESALDLTDDENTAVVATRIAQASRHIDHNVAERAAWRALGSMELGFNDRQNLESLLGELYRDFPISERSGENVDSDPVSIAEPPENPRRIESLIVDSPEQWEMPEITGEYSSPDPESPQTLSGGVHAESGGKSRSAPIDFEFASRQLQVVDARPSDFTAEGLVIEADGGIKKRIPFERVGALCVVAIEGFGEKPVILVDLVLNWQSESNDPLKLIRLRADRFDPRRFVSDELPPLDAMRSFIDQLLEKTGATPLPDLQSARGLPFASFTDLQSYQRDVLSVDETVTAYEFDQ